MPKQPFRVHVEPVQRTELDTRRLARLIVELATRQTELQKLLVVVDEPNGSQVHLDSAVVDPDSTEEAA